MARYRILGDYTRSRLVPFEENGTERLISADRLKRFIREKQKAAIESSNASNSEMALISCMIYDAFMEWIDIQPTLTYVEREEVTKSDTKRVSPTGKG